ncbi:MAG TPA: oligopeptide/dipeptide ABC transporter ATP-binding protein [Thermoplasmata archaeon]|nr:oligopeptide/dipeptide ABC transporter ATP-binding protein [Thermoplasmata archaeon]
MSLSSTPRPAAATPGEPGTIPVPAVIPGKPIARGGATVGDVILDVRGLRTYFFTYDGVVKALDGVSFNIRRGETVGLVGETGCGKSVTAFSVMRLIADPPGRIMDGTILFKGANLLWGVEREATFKPVPKTNRVKVRRRYYRIKRAQERMSAVRGGGVSMIFQEPTSALNPIFSISDQISEALLLHRGKEIYDHMLNALMDGPQINEAVARLRVAVGKSDEEARQSAVLEIDRATNVPGAGDHFTELFRRGGKTMPAIQPYLLKAQQEQVEKALTHVLEVARNPDPVPLRNACDELGRAANLPSLSTQAFYILRGSHANPQARLPQLRKALARRKLNAFHRGFLLRERRLHQLSRELKRTYMTEMRKGKLETRARSYSRSQSLSVFARTFYYNLWGLRGYAKRPLREETFWETVRLLEGVTIANPVQVAKGYPHELSGGMLQRVMIAMALSSDPELLIADEPTTALDVTIQAQILELMRDLKSRIGSAVLLITHDLGVIAEVADRVCVMYAGNIVEVAPVRELYRQPLHPYTQGLLNSIPRMDDPNKKLESIPGSVPNLIYPPSGCRFHPRCPHAMPVCKEKRPPMTIEGEGHMVACYLYNGPAATA